VTGSGDDQLRVWRLERAAFTADERAHEVALRAARERRHALLEAGAGKGDEKKAVSKVYPLLICANPRLSCCGVGRDASKQGSQATV